MASGAGKDSAARRALLEPANGPSSHQHQGGMSEIQRSWLYWPWRAFKDLLAFKSIVVIVLAPLLASPLLMMDSQSMKCAYVVVVMGSYWMFEVMPLAVTSLIPTFAFPILGILSAKETSYAYLPHINFLFIGGLIMALAVEKCNLHQRVALRVMTIVGSQPKIMLGFMCTTAFLSMWMSNTATTAMMVPIAQSVVLELAANNKANKATRRSRTTSVTKHHKGDPEPAVAMHLMNEELKKIDSQVEVSGSDLDQEKRDRLRELTKASIQAGVTEENRERRRRSSSQVDVSLVHPATADQPPSDMNLAEMSPEDMNMAKAMLIAIAFAANIGGTGTITGTPPNLVLVDAFDSRYLKAKGMISFLAWMQFALPLMLVGVIVCWFCVCVVFLGIKEMFQLPNPMPLIRGCAPSALRRRLNNAWARLRRLFSRSQADDADLELNGVGSPPIQHVDPVTAMIQKKYNDLPPMSFGEISVLILFIILLGLWIFRDPKVIPGFGAIFKKGFFTDATSAMLISVLLFVFPDKRPDWLCFRRGQRARQDPKVRGTLMDWPTMQHKFPWSVVLLLGGGFALAKGVKASGLSDQIGELLKSFESLDKLWLQLLCILITMFVTNICSNTVTAVIFLQIVSTMSEKLRYHPLFFMLPTTLSCSYAFVLPVATPPNAIAFASGLLSVIDLMKAGGLITIASIGMIMAYMNTYAYLFWPLDSYPAWAPLVNATSAVDVTANATVPSVTF